MGAFMRCVNRTYRLSNTYRAARLSAAEEAEGLNACQHIYIFQVCRHPGISQEQLARRLCVNKSNVTRQLAALEQSGFVRREPDKADRRMQQVYPTARAATVFPLVCTLMEEWENALLEVFDPQEKEQLLRMMERIQQRAEQLTYPAEQPGERESR